MAISSLELWQRIAAEGLASSMQCRSWAAEVANLLSAESCTDGLKVLQKLIELNKLTKYQAKILAGQSDDLLKRGSWLIRSRVKHPVWRGWLEVAKIDPSTSNPQATWARWLSAQEVQQLRPSAPSIQRGIQLASLQAEHWQRIEMPELQEDELLLRVAPVAGEVLSDAFAHAPTPARVSIEIIRQCAVALSALHAKRIVHGRVTPDRIFWDDRQGVTLVCDPIASVTLAAIPATNGGQGHSGVLGQGMVDLSAVSFLPPEFQAPGQMSSQASDVYALGATWWWLLTGQVPVKGDSLAEILSVAASQPLDFDNQQLDLPEPLLLCLKHCLAKNPSVRFPNAAALVQALDAAAKSVAKGKVEVVSTPSGRPVEIVVPVEAKQTVPQPVAVKTALPSSNRSKLAETSLRKRKRKANWLLPAMGGCGFLVLLLLALKFSGALDSHSAPMSPQHSSPRQSVANSKPSTEPTSDAGNPHSAGVEDPLVSHYRVTESSDLPWAPPEFPAPLQLDLLPPGAQFFVCLRPASILSSATARSTIEVLTSEFELDSLLKRLSRMIGLPLEQVEHVTIAYYDAAGPEQSPDFAVRVQLIDAVSVNQLRAHWGDVTEKSVSEQILLINESNQAVYVPGLEQGDSTLVSTFSVGMIEPMSAVARSDGIAEPLNPQLKQLLERSSRHCDVCILGSPRYLFSNGRGLTQQLPRRLQELISELIGWDSRAALLQTVLADPWYWELQIIGASDGDAPRLTEVLDERASAVSADLEAWLVNELPHSYWRGLALRLPQMMRSWRQHARFGVEDGIAIGNGYLPVQATSNLVVAAWIALQDTATEAADSSDPHSLPAQTATVPLLSVDQYLGRKIRLSFAQEPIGRALTLIGDEANAQLPSGSAALRFVLDGSSFEKAGITRNQQLRDFSANDQSVREVLTEIAKRGNPIAKVKDTRHPDQQLVWVVTEDLEKPGTQMILLTTRSAAEAAKMPLPPEFASTHPTDGSGE